jgi:uncharacterized phage protein gp47/JayE
MMPIQRPTPAQIRDRMTAELQAALGIDPPQRRSVEAALIRAQAGAAHELYGYVDWVARQVMPDTADADQLDRHAALWGVARRPAAASTGLVRMTGTSGALIPAGTEMRRSDGMVYHTLEAATVTNTVAEIRVEAGTAGIEGDAAVGTRLQLVAPIVGVASTITVTPDSLGRGIIGGAAAEDDRTLRARIVATIRRPPQGGAAEDYRRWALEVPGVAAAFVIPGHMGPGTVGVAITVDGTDPIPPAPLVAEVQSYIDARRPVTAAVTVFEPTVLLVTVRLQITPATAAAAVRAEVVDLFRRAAVPGGVFRRSWITEAVSLAAGEEDSRLIEPAEDIRPGVGEIPVLLAVEFV